jgi:hypothetical protein
MYLGRKGTVLENKQAEQSKGQYKEDWSVDK